MSENCITFVIQTNHKQLKTKVVHNKKFENRNNSVSPRISKLKHKDVNIYFIEVFYGCTCGYIGCDGMRLHAKKIKVRDGYGRLLKSKSGKSFIKVPFSLEVTEQVAISLYNEHY